jgi:hypothetical protein
MGHRLLWRISTSHVLYWRILGIISEEQNWRKLIYEKHIAYVGRYVDIGGKYIGECSRNKPDKTWQRATASGRRSIGRGDLRADYFFRPWNSGGAACRGYPLISFGI